MQAKLFCKFGEFAGKEFDISNEATIGTSSSNTIVLKAGTISGNHARIFFDTEEKYYFLEDLGSINGTKLDGIKVTQKEKLRDLHAIVFANKHKFLFQVIVGEESVAQASPPAQVEPVEASEPVRTAPEPASPQENEANKTAFDDGPIVIPSGVGEESSEPATDDENMSGTVLEEPVSFPTNIKEEITPPAESGDKTVFSDDLNFPGLDTDPAESESDSENVMSEFLLEVKEMNQTFELKNGENTIGRGEDCDIALSHPSVSSNHACITIKSGEIRLRDLGSKNKTYIKNKSIDSELELNLNTKIVFGGVEAKLVSK